MVIRAGEGHVSKESATHIPNRTAFPQFQYFWRPYLRPNDAHSKQFCSVIKQNFKRHHAPALPQPCRKFL